jgi:serine/threonine protein kinase
MKLLYESMQHFMLGMEALLHPTRRAIVKASVGNPDVFSDFIERMLKYDPKDRPSGLEMSRHSWLK